VVFILTGGIFQSDDKNYNSISEHQKVIKTEFKNTLEVNIPTGMDFLRSSQSALPGVVHIQSLFGSEFSINPLEGFFNQEARSSGSGVIISDDGYIATNYHVIRDAGIIEITLNDNRTYSAKVIGTDETTDLALLKIEEDKLTFVPYGNSDIVMLGEWVLAIGNPFNLNSTVTAGIVSAKARNIGVLRTQSNLQIESFIQTDAAVNPGNSGGALVNLKGELIGINTAIATHTGSYQGYSFAVPVSLVKKVMDDLLEYGSVQRGLLGVYIQDMNAHIAERNDLELVSGVLISNVNRSSAAEEAGLQKGDIIVAINKYPVKNTSELQEYVARNRPGDQIEVHYVREKKSYSVQATLRNSEGKNQLSFRDNEIDYEGAHFKNLTLDQMKKNKLKGGVIISNGQKSIWNKAGITDGFIITTIDKVNIFNVTEFKLAMENKKGGVLIEGIDAKDNVQAFALDWGK